MRPHPLHRILLVLRLDQWDPRLPVADAAMDWSAIDSQGVQVLLSAAASTESPSKHFVFFGYILLRPALPCVLPTWS